MLLVRYDSITAPPSGPALRCQTAIPGAHFSPKLKLSESEAVASFGGWDPFASDQHYRPSSVTVDRNLLPSVLSDAFIGLAQADRNQDESFDDLVDLKFAASEPFADVSLAIAHMAVAHFLQELSVHHLIQNEFVVIEFYLTQS